MRFAMEVAQIVAPLARCNFYCETDHCKHEIWLTIQMERRGICDAMVSFQIYGISDKR